jgi:hypothetical protein
MDERHVTFTVPKLSRVRLGSISRIRLHHGLSTMDGSRFRQTICEFVMLPWNMPEPNLRLPVRSALFKQRTGGLVVRWVTTGESPLLYVFDVSFYYFK